ncbi:hypothetical protein [Rhodoferax sp.]|uniref:hypothetical protein n=1 Tax=Rhodoferax sp. TaxID=50421 RepID=UPI003783DDA4
MADIEAALKLAVGSCPMLDEAHVFVDIGFSSIQIRTAGEKCKALKSLAHGGSFMISVPAHQLAKAPLLKEQANALP